MTRCPSACCPRRRRCLGPDYALHAMLTAVDARTEGRGSDWHAALDYGCGQRQPEGDARPVIAPGPTTGRLPSYCTLPATAMVWPVM